MSEVLDKAEPLPVGSAGDLGVGLWGAFTLIATEAALFACLLFAYAFTAVQQPRAWFPAGAPKLALAGPNTLLLLASSAAVAWGQRGLKAGKPARLTLGLAVAMALGGAFVGIQLLEWREKGSWIATNGYSSFFFTITGFHMAHVIAGLAALALTLVWNLLGYFDEKRRTAVTVSGLYWHFVDVVWLFVFTAFYLAPYVA